MSGRRLVLLALMGIVLLEPACMPRPSTGVVERVPPPFVHRAAWRLEPQPVQDYGLSYRRGYLEPSEANPMRFYTRIGTDYGLMGTEKRHAAWSSDGSIRVRVRYDQWTGMWHSLDGLAAERRPGLELTAAYPAQILPGLQARVVGAYARVRGTGRFGLEIARRDACNCLGTSVIRSASMSLDREERDHLLVWPGFAPEHLIEVADLESWDTGQAHGRALDSVRDLAPVAMLNWVVTGPGAQLEVDEIGLLVELPELPLERRLMLKSLAKLARCYDPAIGLVGDRANFPVARMASVPASGMFCLAMAAAQAEGMVRREDASQVLRQTHRVVSDRERMPRRGGLLPHFVHLRGASGRFETRDEYSSVDSALYYHAMLLAAGILEQSDLIRELEAEIRTIDARALLKDGFVSMGIDAGGQPLNAVWDAWGGEGALVLMLMRMAGAPPPYRLYRSDAARGQVYQGRGFIAELQSLFVPDFDQNGPDALSRVDWLEARRAVLAEQVATTREHFPGTLAATLGLYGFSSGERADGAGYLENGTRRPAGPGDDRPAPLPILFPHYMLMSAQSAPDLREISERLRALETHGLFPPWGAVENFDVRLERSLALIGSLNASFEVLSAYHLLCRLEGRPDVIYEAARRSPVMREAVRMFYPDGGAVPQVEGRIHRERPSHGP